MDAHPVVLFDGVCNLCNASVQLIIDRDPAAHFRFASLQSDVGQQLLAQVGAPPETPDSVLLVENGKLYIESEAALRIARHLRGPLRLTWVLLAVPHQLRDPAYRFIARNRYRWFGKSESCRVPTPELRARFLDVGPARS